MEKVYAKALIHLIEGGKSEAELFKLLKKHLEEKGRLKLLPKIKRELERMAARRKKEYSKLEVASESETAQALKELKTLGIEIHGSKVNHALIKGWRTVQKDTLVDRSAKQQLVTLYTNIIK